MNERTNKRSYEMREGHMRLFLSFRLFFSFFYLGVKAKVQASKLATAET